MDFEKYNQPSIYDTLIRMVPDIKNRLQKKEIELVSPDAANSLYSIWRAAENKVDKSIFKRPATTSLHEIESMQKEGLIRSLGSKVEITDKGSKVLKVMILGDDSSSFDKEDIVIDYSQALAKMKNIKVAKKNQKVAANWWSKFLK